MFNRATFNLKHFDMPEKPTAVQFRDALKEQIDAAAPELILTVPESFTAANSLQGLFSVLIHTYRASLEIPFNLQRLLEIIKETGLEAAYNHFVSKPELPFVLIRRESSVNMFADNVVFYKGNRWNVILCTEKKSSETERIIEAAFDENEICWEVIEESYIKEERLYQVIYEFTEREDPEE